MRARGVWPTVLAALLLAVGAAAPAQARAPIQPAFALTTAPMSAADQAALPAPDVSGARTLGDYDTPGVLYGVWDPTRGVAQRGFGLSNRDARTPMLPDQSFRIGSVTKTFTATAVLLLVGDGKVKLDAPVARYVGTLADALPNGRTATVRSLLNMTSGFPDYAARGDGPFATAVLTPYRVWRPAELVAAASRYASTPRGAFSYSNTNYVILGELVARQSHLPFGAFVKRRILDPLGLRETRIPTPTATAPVTMHGYLDATWTSFSPPPSPQLQAVGRAGEDVTTWSTSAAGAAAGGVSTLNDLARWAADDFGDVLLSPRLRAARLRRVPSGGLLRGSAYGLGLQLEHGWHFHVGEVLGWETLLMANPRTAQVVAVVRNACCGSAFENYRTARAAMPGLASIVDPVYGN